MPIRIHAIWTRYPHWGVHSGIAQYLGHLDPARFAVTRHIALDGDDDFPVRNWRFRALLRRGVQRRGMAWYKLSDVRAEASAFRRSAARAADIVHYLDGEHSAQYLPLLRRLPFARARLIATYHQPASLLPELVRSDVVRQLDCVTVVSPAQAEFFAELLPADRVHTILHGVDTGFFRPPPDRPDRDDFACITAGHWLRDFAALRQVAERLADCAGLRFHVVTGKQTGLEHLSNVTLHRNVPDATLLELYQRADLLLLPLQDCTANNALLEGMACGLPVITTDLASVRAYAPGEEAIRLPTGDANAIVQTLLRLRLDPAARLSMSRAARGRAETLSWDRVAHEYELVYQAVMDEVG